MIASNKKFKRLIKPSAFTLVLILIIIGVIIFLDKSGRTSILLTNGNDSDSKSEPASTTSSEPSAQPDFKSGNDKSTGSTGSDTGSATVTDTQGSTSMTGQGKSSSSGDITVYAPVNGAQFNGSQEIKGTSSLDSVSYRIIDDVSGVIADGTLQVNGGRFSGKVMVDTTAKQGRLDVFATKSDGSEYDNIEIMVSF